MNKILKKPELLAPAGNLEKLRIALDFGADAVYFGLPEFSLRARINEFGKKEIEKGAEICRQKGKKFYITFNIYAHNSHLKEIPKSLKFIAKIKPDGLIISDPGILELARKFCPEVPLHISTQANVTNVEAVKFWQKQGVTRIVLAREVTLKEIAEIKKAAGEMELEYFVHGAMCMSYSGRCILSKWMTGRSANLGDCAQPCRWQYKAKTVVDDQGRFEVGVEEDQHGTYLFNSYDLCLIEHIEDLIKAGVDSLKIEGRAKSSYYVALSSKAYRKVIDAVCSKNMSKKEVVDVICQQKKELENLSNRGYFTGFLSGNEPPHLFDQSSKSGEGFFAGISNEDICARERTVTVHNFVYQGDLVDIITPLATFQNKIVKIVAPKKGDVLSAHGGQGITYKLTFKDNIEGVFLMRRHPDKC